MLNIENDIDNQQERFFMKEKIRQLFVEYNKTIFEISELFQISKDNVTNILKEFGFDKFTDRKYYLLKAKPLTKEQKEFIIGCLLGNGLLKKYGKKSDFYLHIEEVNRNVILWKKLHLPNFVNVINFNNKYWFNTLAHNELNSLHKKIYNNNKKTISEELQEYISPLSLAVLFLDKGWVRNEGVLRFKTNNFSLSDHQNLQKILQNNFDIESKICEYVKNNKQYYYLSVNKVNTEKLMKIIDPFIKEILRD